MSFLTTTAGANGILPEETGALITGPLEAESIAFNENLATVIHTASHTFSVPILKEDAGAAWVAEGEEISPDDPVLAELVITPTKAAGLTIISREIANDSAPEAQELVGEGLARSIVTQVDTAFLGSLAAPAQSGLGALPSADVDTWKNHGTVDTAGAITNLDPFAEAVAKCETAGGNITGWLMHPTDALAISKLKDSTNSNKSLLENPRVILGRPVIVSAKATAGELWGIDKAAVITVLREDTEVAVSNAPFFTSDRIALRATTRVGLGFAIPNRLVKIYDVTPGA